MRDGPSARGLRGAVALPAPELCGRPLNPADGRPAFPLSPRSESKRGGRPEFSSPRGAAGLPEKTGRGRPPNRGLRSGESSGTRTGASSRGAEFTNLFSSGSKRTSPRSVDGRPPNPGRAFGRGAVSSLVPVNPLRGPSVVVPTASTERIGASRSKWSPRPGRPLKPATTASYRVGRTLTTASASSVELVTTGRPPVITAVA